MDPKIIRAREVAKVEAARLACNAWAVDWGGEKGVRAPTAGQLVRAVVMYLYTGDAAVGLADFCYYGVSAFERCLQFNQAALNLVRRPMVRVESIPWFSYTPAGPYQTVPTLERAGRLWERYAAMCRRVRAVREAKGVVAGTTAGDGEDELEMERRTR